MHSGYQGQPTGQGQLRATETPHTRTHKKIGGCASHRDGGVSKVMRHEEINSEGLERSLKQGLGPARHVPCLWASHLTLRAMFSRSLGGDGSRYCISKMARNESYTFLKLGARHSSVSRIFSAAQEGRQTTGRHVPPAFRGHHSQSSQEPWPRLLSVRPAGESPCLSTAHQNWRALQAHPAQQPAVRKAA